MFFVMEMALALLTSLVVGTLISSCFEMSITTSCRSKTRKMRKRRRRRRMGKGKAQRARRWMRARKRQRGKRSSKGLNAAIIKFYNHHRNAPTPLLATRRPSRRPLSSFRTPRNTPASRYPSILSTALAGSRR